MNYGGRGVRRWRRFGQPDQPLADIPGHVPILFADGEFDRLLGLLEILCGFPRILGCLRIIGNLEVCQIGENKRVLIASRAMR